MPKKPDHPLENHSLERPLECSECRKNIAICYTEMTGKQMSTTRMCANCPQLERRLTGAKQTENISREITHTGLACGNCGTTLEQVRVSTPLGCTQCYEVFSDIIVAELEASDKIPARLTSSKKRSPLHKGRAPGQIPEVNPSARLMALNEALNETLKREEYEQAAALRDQIKALTENVEKKDE